MSSRLIIASPQLDDPNFARSVILVCQHDETGAFGLIINRDGPVSIGAVTERMDLGEPAEPDSVTWWGGPVGPGTGFVIWRGEADDSEGWNLRGDIAVSPSAERLKSLVQTQVPFFLCLGYAGWGAGQLDHEIETGSWLYADVEPTLIFDVPLDERYDRALMLLGLTAYTVSMTPIEA